MCKHGLDTGINAKGIFMLFSGHFLRPAWIFRVRKGSAVLYKHTGRIHLQNKGYRYQNQNGRYLLSGNTDAYHYNPYRTCHLSKIWFSDRWAESPGSIWIYEMQAELPRIFKKNPQHLRWYHSFGQSAPASHEPALCSKGSGSLCTLPYFTIKDMLFSFLAQNASYF